MVSRSGRIIIHFVCTNELNQLNANVATTFASLCSGIIYASVSAHVAMTCDIVPRKILNI